MLSITLYTHQRKRLLTLKEAEQKGYGSVYTLKQRIRRNQLKGHKVGPLWLVPEASLSRPTERRRTPKGKKRN